MGLKWLALGGVVAACLGFLIFSATTGTAEYYQTIAEVHSHPGSGTVRVLGTVQGDITRDGGDHITFTAADAGQTMPVEYTGTLPDIFKPGAQVVVEGSLRQDGTFQATAVLGKCPSKFSSAKPQGSL
jgi:cytochrome c-type biogenesis protein CcmE